MHKEVDNTSKPKSTPSPPPRNATAGKDITNYTVLAAASAPKGGSAPISKAPGDSSSLPDGASSTNDAAPKVGPTTEDKTPSVNTGTLGGGDPPKRNLSTGDGLVGEDIEEDLGVPAPEDALEDESEENSEDENEKKLRREGG
jgi:hypothetical protein